MKKNIVLFLFMMLGSTFSVFAQRETNPLAIQVIDGFDSKSILGANIEVFNARKSLSGKTDRGGKIAFDQLKDDKYNIVITHPNFEKVDTFDHVHGGQQFLQFRLRRKRPVAPTNTPNYESSIKDTVFFSGKVREAISTSTLAEVEIGISFENAPWASSKTLTNALGEYEFRLPKSALDSVASYYLSFTKRGFVDYFKGPVPMPEYYNNLPDNTNLLLGNILVRPRPMIDDRDPNFRFYSDYGPATWDSLNQILAIRPSSLEDTIYVRIKNSIFRGELEIPVQKYLEDKRVQDLQLYGSFWQVWKRESLHPGSAIHKWDKNDAYELKYLSFYISSAVFLGSLVMADVIYYPKYIEATETDKILQYRKLTQDWDKVKRNSLYTAGAIWLGNMIRAHLKANSYFKDNNAKRNSAKSTTLNLKISPSPGLGIMEYGFVLNF